MVVLFEQFLASYGQYPKMIQQHATMSFDQETHLYLIFLRLIVFGLFCNRINRFLTGPIFFFGTDKGEAVQPKCCIFQVDSNRSLLSEKKFSKECIRCCVLHNKTMSTIEVMGESKTVSILLKICLIKCAPLRCYVKRKKKLSIPLRITWLTQFQPFIGHKPNSFQVTTLTFHSTDNLIQACWERSI